ncbi:multiple sugar transport system permease protein [Bacillus niacini]|uniref:Multiple sugar transport system permease protein n=1 Tax=Neobacillus niacini TaxID=86668 RepID=A0A852T9S7_9BACI|nr:sugar ABC transporter permease [Neobacillus niacini]NYE04238.1 multiple sugar transport system permease protein [Neobacillus niacini]
MNNNHARNDLVEYFRKVSFILPAITLLLLLTAYPLYQVILMSFYDYTDKANPIFAGIKNYTEFIVDPLFWNALGNTVVFTIVSVFSGLSIGLIFALLLNQQINTKFRAIFRSVLMFPWLTSSTVVAAIFMLIFNPFGLVNKFLSSIGFTELSQTAWLGDENTALLAVIVANIWRGFPFMMLMLLAGLQTISNDLYEAAEIDGAGFFKKLFYITIPQLKNIILTLVILEFIWNFRSFDLVFLMTGGGPMNSTEVLSTYIYHHAFRTLDFGYASATAIFMLLIMVALSFFYLKSSIKKEGE